MARIIVVSNPSDDTPTEYLSTWSKEITAIARQQVDTVVFDLKKEEANREELTELIEKENPHLVIFNGHGNDESIMGFNQSVLIKLGDNEKILRDKIVHSMACESAKTLGPSCIELGTKAFIGYTEKFVLVHTNQVGELNQKNDKIARLFLDPAFEAILALIEGVDANTAYTRSQDHYRDNLAILLTSNKTDHNTVLASHLYHNLKYQVCLGDQKALL